MPSGSEPRRTRDTSRSDASRPPRDDRVFGATRAVAIVVLPFLAIAVVVLFLFPTRTGELFAWPIDPPMSAYLLASAYVGGLWFFARTATARRWHTVRHGFPAVVLFALALLVATLLHLAKFSTNVPFIVWMILYATTPFAVAILAIGQARHDPGSPEENDFVLPRGPRIALVVIGAAAFVDGVVLFFAPQLAIAIWAWQLTPLTAQVTGAVLSLTGVVNVALVWDPRWSSFRPLFQAQLISLAAIAVSLVVRGADLKWDRPVTPLFIGLVAAAILAYGGFTLWCERASRRL